jgi:hypothetical protein
MDETLSEYNSGTKISVNLLVALEGDDFSNLNYGTIKHTELFKSFGMTNLQDYIREKNISLIEQRNLYQKFDYLLGKVIDMAVDFGVSESDIYKLSKCIINFDKIVWVKLYTIEYLNYVEQEIMNAENSKILKQK